MAEDKTIGGWMDVTSEVRNDIVFEGRNKAYGAYFVRRKYQRTILMALGIASATMIVGISIPLILKALNFKKKEEVMNVKVNLTAPPPINPNTPPPPPPPPPPKPLVNQLKVTPPVIAKINVDTTIATVKQVQVTNAGTSNQKGKDTMIIAPPTNNGLGDDLNKVFTIVQQKPAFPGDINKYLAEHINYPEQAKDANIQGTVYVSFIVERDGSVTQVTVLRGVNNYLDNEAKRVISTMPRWSPGQQNGHAVRVQYMVPIRFILR